MYIEHEDRSHLAAKKYLDTFSEIPSFPGTLSGAGMMHGFKAVLLLCCIRLLRAFPNSVFNAL